ncbi:hypothetical protein BKA93DRAFT_746071 [Sparassis latifolia]
MCMYVSRKDNTHICIIKHGSSCLALMSIHMVMFLGHIQQTTLVWSRNAFLPKKIMMSGYGKYEQWRGHTWYIHSIVIMWEILQKTVLDKVPNIFTSQTNVPYSAVPMSISPAEGTSRGIQDKDYSGRDYDQDDGRA